MNDHFQINIAQDKLSKWENLFNKYENSWSDAYKEYFLIEKMQIISPLLRMYIFNNSNQYPKIAYYLHVVKDSIEVGLAIYAPESVQQAISSLAKIALQINISNEDNDKKTYIDKAHYLNYSSRIIRYYREAIDAHKLFSDYLLYGDTNPSTIKEASAILCGISDDPRLGWRDLISFRKLKFNINRPLVTSIDQIIREGETHFVEFKAAYIPNTNRSFNKEKIIEQRLEEIVAFLNSDGGMLLIGIDDDGSIHGIDDEIEEFYSTIDNFRLTWTNLFRERIAIADSLTAEKKTGFITHATVSHEPVSYNGKTIYIFKCNRQNKDVIFYLRDKKNYSYFIRNNVSKRKIQEEGLKQYLSLIDYSH